MREAKPLLPSPPPRHSRPPSESPLPLEATTPHQCLTSLRGEGSHTFWRFHSCIPELELFYQPAILSVDKRTIGLHRSQQRNLKQRCWWLAGAAWPLTVGEISAAARGTAMCDPATTGGYCDEAAPRILFTTAVPLPGRGRSEKPPLRAHRGARAVR
jgi:hypothetical protein